MAAIAVGQVLSDLELQSDTGPLKLSQFKGKNLVIYFYPKDNTPGCTTESKDFRDQQSQFEKLNTVILGVSRDNLKSHEKFKTKHCLPFPLISDENSKLSEYFDVLKNIKFFGKNLNMIQRSTFLFDKNGVLRHEWRKVKVKGHVDEVLAMVKSL